MIVRIFGTAAAIALFGGLTLFGASQHAQAQTEIACQASVVMTQAVTDIERH